MMNSLGRDDELIDSECVIQTRPEFEMTDIDNADAMTFSTSGLLRTTGQVLWICRKISIEYAMPCAACDIVTSILRCIDWYGRGTCQDFDITRLMPILGHVLHTRRDLKTNHRFYGSVG